MAGAQDLLLAPFPDMRYDAMQGLVADAQKVNYGVAALRDAREQHARELAMKAEQMRLEQKQQRVDNVLDTIRVATGVAGTVDSLIFKPQRDKVEAAEVAAAKQANDLALIKAREEAEARLAAEEHKRDMEEKQKDIEKTKLDLIEQTRINLAADDADDPERVESEANRYMGTITFSPDTDPDEVAAEVVMVRKQAAKMRAIASAYIKSPEFDNDDERTGKANAVKYAKMAAQLSKNADKLEEDGRKHKEAFESYKHGMNIDAHKWVKMQRLAGAADFNEALQKARYDEDYMNNVAKQLSHIKAARAAGIGLTESPEINSAVDMELALFERDFAETYRKSNTSSDVAVREQAEAELEKRKSNLNTWNEELKMREARIKEGRL